MAWWKTAKPGDPVVCVNAAPTKQLVNGRVYRFIRVKSVDTPNVYTGKKSTGVLVEGASPTRAGSFDAERFRPAQSTDLPEELTQLLDQPVSEDMKVGA